MRLSEGIVTDNKGTFGNLKFSALHRETYGRNEKGETTGELLRRTYDLKSDVQGMMIQVILPPEVPEKTFAYNTPVRLVNVVVGAISNATYGGRANGNWIIKAEDIVALDEKVEGDASKTGTAGSAAASGTSAAAGVAGSGTPGAETAKAAQPSKKG